MRTAQALTFTTLLVAAACGGGQTETQPTTAPTSSASAAPTASSTAPAEDAGPPKPSMESQRDPFIQTCMHKVPVQTYCSCAFDQFKDVFKDADLSQKPSPELLATLRTKTSETCGAKLTDADVKPLFTNVCVGNDPRKSAFCACQWTSFRKTLSPGDFLSDFEGPRFDDAKKAMVKACKGKLPDTVAKAEFMQGCEAKAPGKTKFCECSWKKVRAKASSEQIAAGLVDLKSLHLESCKNAH
jgi:hypothetical protein